MKKMTWGILLGALALVSLAAGIKATDNVPADNFTVGDPAITSISQLAFGPDGILFMGDSKTASVFALATGDTGQQTTAAEIDMGAFDRKVAAALGTDPGDIAINDMAVNPLSKAIYFSVTMTDGSPVLLKLKGDQLENVPLKGVKYQQIGLQDPVAEDAEDHRGRPLREWAISDLKYHDGNVLVSGLSNKEFGSTFRSIPFPFAGAQDYASLEIYHAAHGQYETHAPIKTFDVVTLDNADYLMASYTCTPLVLFPLSELREGKHTKGRTVAELGSGNSPLDMISFEKEGKKYFAMSNSSRPVMKIAYEDLATTEASLTDPVDEFAVAAGLPYVSLPMVHILQLDVLDGDKVVYLHRTADGELVLRSRTTKWM